MRNLTIKRTKSFVACLAKMKIYVEDSMASELVINNVPCRKLGELKNGEEKTFVIGDNSAKIFVIADTLSRNYCNEYYQLPDGQDDIFLSGKNNFNPASGNAFRFDNNNNADVIANRKSGSRKGLIILIASVVIGVILGFAIGSGIFSQATPKQETFTSGGITITLTDEFKETEAANFTTVFDSRHVAVLALKESFSLAEGLDKLTIDEYASLTITANDLKFADAQRDGELTYFVYENINPDTKVNYRYYSYVYKASDAFWLVQFATAVNEADEYAPKIAEWAKSVKFN